MKVDKSRQMLDEASRYLAGGVASSLRAAMKPTPLYAAGGRGARVYDVDGNEYVDYLLAYGPLILGHSHPALNERVNQAMQKGYTFGLQHEGEIELAKRLTELLPCADKVVFSGSGTEAVMMALRLARAYTGKQKVVRFHGHYHGWSDAIFTSFPSPDMKSKAAGSDSGEAVPGTGGQSENSLDDIILLPWNEPELLERTLRDRREEIAAVITEPVMCNSGCISPQKGYLENMRKLTEQLGIVLIFDEVITGFRLGLGGAHERFGIVPDLMTMGKALAGGIALSAVAGKHDIMNLVAEGRVDHLGTLNGNTVSTAAAMAVLDELGKDDGAAYARMEKIAETLAEGLRNLMQKYNIQGIVNQPGPVFHMMFTDQPEVVHFDQFGRRDAAKYSRFAELMLAEGVLIRPNGLWYVSIVHGEREIADTLKAVESVFSKYPEFSA
ncbi:aspartate aminotransferase family protein [Paenibacillus sp. J2TS4]|uniref:aspartate aminotransferase family protein n=1 Tax=Paenibacillus sp. J2TS4 TaxID=2807194 RepID=UPI001B17C223|nr:aspartate aminotransferase family protein [Paenibacillus sp. J2TS4]GIP34997.1 glutamate-1-semialdehyde-2,1-aminomutase [Paenibacillus sp. J2TS4]